MLVHRGVVRQFRVERSGQDVFALHQRGLARIFREDFHAGPGAFNHWAANEDHFERLFFEYRGPAYDVAGNLPPIGISYHGHVHEVQRILSRVLHVFGEEDRSSTSSENCFAALREFHDLVVEYFYQQKLELHCALHAWYMKPSSTIQSHRCSYL